MFHSVFSIVIIIFSFEFINFFINNINYNKNNNMFTVISQAPLVRLVCPTHWHSAQAPRVRLVCPGYSQATQVPKAKQIERQVDAAWGATNGHGLPSAQAWQPSAGCPQPH
jgi:hypothetical protein